MQIGTVTNQYINNYHNTASVQTYNAQQVRQVQDMSETRLMEYHQEQYREPVSYTHLTLPTSDLV